MSTPRAACLALTLALFGGSCRRSHAHETKARAVRVSAPRPILEPIFRAGLQGDWDDYGWSPHDPKARGAPARMSFSGYGGWILANSHVTGDFGGLRFRIRAPASFGDFLEVRLDSKRSDVFPRVRPGSTHGTALPGGWMDVFIPIEELNPDHHVFDRVVFRTYKEVPDVPVEFDEVGLTARDPSRPTASGRAGLEPGEERSAQLLVDCTAPTHAINPLIYGIAYAPRKDAQDWHQWKVGATARRWGGNPTTRYNWELGNAWNTGADYFYRNVNYTGIASYTYDDFLQADLLAGVQTALTVPMIGFVAKDTRSVGFPVSTFGPQQDLDPDLSDAGNGISAKGKKLEPGPPALTSVPAPPEFVGRWVRAIRAKDAQRGRTVQMYILDNEPMLWNDTHRDIHPKATSYDELVERTIAYGSAVRKADPEAVIAGPAEWGWPAYFASALDAVTNGADRKQHGNVPLMAYYLRKLREHELRTGEKVLNVLDLHFYPQVKGLGINEGGKTDDVTNAQRIRSTRGLWDPTYRDESWIAENIQLIPRMKAWIAENYPGLGISIGEYNFGAETHMSGGLAVAEALGRFGEQGITSAFYWTYPAADSPAAWAFRAFRNYDGKGSHFGDVSLRARGAENVSVFASRAGAAAQVVAVVLNTDPHKTLNATFELRGCAAKRVLRAWTYAGGPSGFEPAEKVATGLRLDGVAPYSMTVVELAP